MIVVIIRPLPAAETVDTLSEYGISATPFGSCACSDQLSRAGLEWVTLDVSEVLTTPDTLESLESCLSDAIAFVDNKPPVDILGD